MFANGVQETVLATESLVTAAATMRNLSIEKGMIKNEASLFNSINCIWTSKPNVNIHSIVEESVTFMSTDAPTSNANITEPGENETFDFLLYNLKGSDKSCRRKNSNVVGITSRKMLRPSNVCVHGIDNKTKISKYILILCIVTMLCVLIFSLIFYSLILRSM